MAQRPAHGGGELMLAPDSRHLFSDVLRPPPGYVVDVAVGTTYSLDLAALLLVPMTFALHDATDMRGQLNDPVAVLHGLRRHADHTTVFCQAGELAVPRSYQPLFAHLEDVVHEVTAPAEGRLFHPKLWAVRLRSPDGELQHRVVCLSRNLTFDRSWDTVVRLDETDAGARKTITAEPLRDFLSALPGRSVTTVSAQRRRQINDLVAGLEGVVFEVPAPFRSGELLPLGLGTGNDPFAGPVSRAVVISPFLDAAFTALVCDNVAERTWVSRSETFDRMGGDAFADDSVFVLQPQAESDDGSGEPDQQPHDAGVPSRLSGLHAKVLVLEERGSATVISGSANATWAGWNGNVEFGVALTGPSDTCGVESLLADAGSGKMSFRSVLMPYETTAEAASEPVVEALEYEIDEWLRTVATEPLDLFIEGDVEPFNVLLRLPDVPALGTTRVAPAPLRFVTHSRDWERELTWQRLTLRDLSPYIAVEVQVQRDRVTATGRRLLVARLHGDVADRGARLLSQFLRSKDDVLRLLLLLLGDEAAAELFAAELAGGEAGKRWKRAATADTPLFERFVRALANDHAALERVHNLRNEMESDPYLVDLLPEGFDELWQPVRQVWQEQAR
ncbi:phospholipase D family protein [Saccharopolyspora phatthalungensis]|uniref:PLD phosphodiesterase domain-containing protein n=1 Tax=Saccharopolyspora phatthalungensis TaxID=664693 RepID=A0A840QA55_9PSEU|nr:phospholipase D family protein [Saccharopolyspora phatthalungensis]MBB5153703.1 hypothetical protein [Saccharopolyspora phatthalungensis]